jgi:hypothetical protein
VIGCCKRYKHHFIVRVVELKELAAHLCVIYSRMTQMLAATTSGNYDGACTQHNTLSPSAYLSYSATPAFPARTAATTTTRIVDESHPSRASEKKKAGYKMIVDQVNTLFRDRGWSGENNCPKRAVLCGHVEITKDTTKEDVLLRGTCLRCGDESPVSCTIEDALNQPCYAGLHY